jgi:hypothetical protein
MRPVKSVAVPDQAVGQEMAVRPQPGQAQSLE